MIEMTTLTPSGFLTVGASHLEYRMIGPSPESAPTIVMLHEGLGSAGLWGDFPEKLQAATGADGQEARRGKGGHFDHLTPSFRTDREAS